MRATSGAKRYITSRAASGVAVLAILLLAGVERTQAAEIIPSVGWSRPVDGDEAKISGGVAFRGDLLPILKDEIAVSYRSDSQMDGLLRVRQWPITASLWLQPVPSLYAGGGVGFYHMTLDYDQDRIPLAIQDETREEFGVHLGGGLRVPLAPTAALDLGGRYVMMRDQESRLVPQKFDPDFWNASVGLAFHF